MESEIDSSKYQKEAIKRDSKELSFIQTANNEMVEQNTHQLKSNEQSASLTKEDKFVFSSNIFRSQFIVPHTTDVKEIKLSKNHSSLIIKIPDQDAVREEEMRSETTKEEAIQYLKENGYAAKKKARSNKVSNEAEITEEIRQQKLKESWLLEACKLIDQGYDRQYVSQLYLMTNKQLNYYYARYKKGILVSKTCLQTKSKLEHLLFLETYLRETKLKITSLSEVQQVLSRKYPGDRFDISSVCRMMKNLQYSRKKAENIINRKNEPLTKEKRCSAVKKLIDLTKQGKKFIYIDETTFNTQSARIYGYTKIGKRFHLESNSRIQSISMIAAMSDEKFLGYQLVKGSVNTKVFGTFILHLIQQYPDIIENRKKYILFLDNATIHRSQIVEPMLENFNVFFNAPFSPFLNPIEYAFGSIKSIFRKNCNRNKDSICQDIGISAEKIEQKHIQSFIRHSFSYYYDSLCLKDIE